MTANSSCDWPSSDAALGADADDAEMDAFDLDRLLERIDVVAEQAIGGLPADARRPAARVSTSVGLISRPRSASKLEKLTYSPVTPWIARLSIDLSR